MSAALADASSVVGPAVPTLQSDSLAVGKTLLLVGAIPGHRNVGELLLREMLALLDPQRFVIAALLDRNWQPGDIDAMGFELRVFACPSEVSVRKLGGWIGTFVAAASRLGHYESEMDRLAREVGEFARVSKVERIWTLLNMTTVIDIGARLHSKLRLPLLVQVWDDVEHLIAERNLDLLTRRRTRRRFATLLGVAERTAVIGESMAANYAKRFGARCQVVRRGVDDRVEAKTEATSSTEFRVGFCGGMYCPSAWKALQGALSQLHWQVAGKRVRLLLMTGRITLSAKQPALIEYLGHLSDHEVRERLRDCDLLYLPQPFEESGRALAELSFPTKLSTYASVGRPIMVHAPAYGSLVDFASKHPLGLVCTTLNPERIAECLSAFASDAKSYRVAAEAVAELGNTELSRRNFEAQLQRFLQPPTDADQAT